MAHHPNNNRNTAMSDEFYRLSLLPPYVIAEINAMRAAARRKGEDVIDLGMGNPDLPPPQHVIDKLISNSDLFKNGGAHAHHFPGGAETKEM